MVESEEKQKEIYKINLPALLAIFLQLPAPLFDLFLWLVELHCDPELVQVLHGLHNV